MLGHLVANRNRALALLGRALAGRSQWRSAIRATRASLALADDPGVRAAYNKLMAEHGFRILEHQVDSDALSPRICVRFSDPLPRNFPNLADFVEVTGGEKLSVEAEGAQICIDGWVVGVNTTLDGEAHTSRADTGPGS